MHMNMHDAQKQLDAEHLRLLGIFHYIVAGLGYFFSLLPTLWLAFGVAMWTGAIAHKPGDPSPELFGFIFIAIGSLFFLFGLGFSTCVVLAGRYLLRRRHYTFCMVMAAIACAFTPFGTVLGVFTLIVLSRQSVRELFGVVPPVVVREAGAKNG